MMGVEQSPAPSQAVSLDEVKAYLRIGHAEEDALLAGLVRSATALCEAFTGQALIARAVAETLPAAAEWRRLSVTPVRMVEGMEDAGGGVMPVDSYAVDIDRNGDGWVRAGAVAPGRVTVKYQAGIASDWNGLPEALRQGIIRLVAHMHAHRDGGDAVSPPAAVAALWRPWRRMRLK